MVALHSKQFCRMAWRRRTAIGSSAAPARYGNYETMIGRMADLARFLPLTLAKMPS
jgi:hypothetical protein